MSSIAAQLSASEGLQRAAMDRLPLQQKWSELERRTEQAEAAFARVTPFRQRKPESADLIDQSHEVWALGNEASDIVRELMQLVRRLERELEALNQDADLWRDNIPVLRQSQVPAQVIDAAQSMAQQTQAAAVRVRQARDKALLALVRAQSLQASIIAETSQIASALDSVLARRSTQESLPIWRLDWREPQDRVTTALFASGTAMRNYLAREWARLAVLFAAVFGVCWWLFTRPPAAGASPARRAYGAPIAASLLVALTALWWLSPDPPLHFYSMLLLVMPLSMAALGRRAFGAAIPLTLYGMAAGTMMMGLRDLIEGSALGERLLVLAQLVSLAGPVALELRDGSLYKAFSRWSPEGVRAAAMVVLMLSAISALHAIFGLAVGSRTLRIGTAGLLGFGLLFGTASLALYGALLTLLSTPLFGWLRSARSADPALLRVLRFALGVLAAVGTALATLGALALVPEALAMLNAVSLTNVEVGAISISSTSIAASLAVVLSTYLVSGMLRFLLEKEILPRLRLRPGVGYAITTFTNWVIVIFGAVLTLAALGVDSTRITVLAGALGVGIGFGLQTVVNNFVSGLILIVERPVAVGDLVEIGPLFGEIQRIGIRSSSVRTTQGAEVIVPNSDFASKEVINWTRSDRQRRYDIDVGVAYGSDPTQVMQLLVEAAGDVPEVMAQPAPLAMFKGFGDSSLDFRLLAWVSTIDLGVKAQSALRIAVLRKLEAAGIAIPFPQRDVYLHAVGDAAPPKPDA